MLQKTLIIGSGACAVSISDKLRAHNVDVVSFSPEGGAESGNTISIDCKGSAGDFEISMNHNGDIRTENAGAVVVSDTCTRQPNFELYQLKPSPAVMALSEVSEKTIVTGGKTVFLTGTVRESNSVIMAEVMNAALMLRKWGESVYVLLNNLKVAGDGLEALYRETREAGVVYVKFTGSAPEINHDDNGVNIEFEDEITRQRFRLTPDSVVVDETLLPSMNLEAVANSFRLMRDEDGFLQTDNVHRYTVLTNRKGVYAAGPARGIMSQADQETDAAAVSALVLSQFRNEQEPADPELKATIDSGNCVRCLTCYRLCSYRAISINNDFRVVVSPDECERCGVCAAECPRGAINVDKLLVEGEGTGGIEKRTSFAPSITAFCCARSAGIAGNNVDFATDGVAAELKTVTVPCGGGISEDLVLNALTTRSDGVLLFACHSGNCHSEHGTDLAWKRATRLSEKLVEAGLEKERIRIAKTAANMSRDYINTLIQFEQDLVEMGPSKLL